MEIKNNLDKFRDEIDGKAVRYSQEFYYDEEFAEILNKWLNKKMLAKQQKVEEAGEQSFKILSYFEEHIFPDKREKAIFEGFIERFGLLTKEIQHKIRTFRAAMYNEAKVIAYIKELLESIYEHDSQGHFPWFEALMSGLEEIHSIADLKNFLHKQYFLIDISSGINKKINIFTSPQHFEQYKSVYMIYKILDAALGTYIYDRRQEAQLDEFIEDQGLDETPVHRLNREEKKEILETEATKKLKKFARMYEKKTGPVQVESQEVSKHLPETSVKITSKFRLKAEASKMRKAIEKNDYFKYIRDYAGTEIRIELPELEAYLAEARAALQEAKNDFNKQEIDRLDEHIDQITTEIRGRKFTIAQDIFGYLPSIIGTYSFKEDRIRPYLTSMTRRKESNEDHQSINTTANEFKVGEYTFAIPIEVQVILTYGEHRTLRENQFLQMATTHQQKATGEEVLRKIAKYVIVSSDEDYISTTAFDPEALNPRKLDDKTYLLKKAKEFRHKNAKRLLLSRYIDCDIIYFKHLFKFNPDEEEKFKEKVTNFTEEEIVATWNKKKSWIRGQVKQFTRKILDNEIEYVIKPLRHELQTRIYSLKQKKEDIGDLQQRIEIIDTYERDIKKAFKLPLS